MTEPGVPTGQDEPPGDEDLLASSHPEVVDEPSAGPTYRLAGEVIQTSVSFRRAPYPTPQDLREYEQIHPGFTDRILTLTERETEHRISQDQFQDAATFALAKRGQASAFIVVMTLVLGGIAGILTGHSLAGFAGLIIAAATLAAAFVVPRVRSVGSDEAGGGVHGTELGERSEPPGQDDEASASAVDG